jgi:hypothetical protein
VVDGDVVQEMNTPAQVVDVDAQTPASAAVEEAISERAPARKRGGRRGKAPAAADGAPSEGAQSQERAADRRGHKDAKVPRARKTPSKPRAPRARPQ